MTRYLCGCECIEERKLDGDNDFLKQFFSYDAEGFIVCRQHLKRRYGWRSVPYTALTTPCTNMGMWTPLQYERFVIFGVISAGSKLRPRPAKMEPVAA